MASAEDKITSSLSQGTFNTEISSTWKSVAARRKDEIYRQIPQQYIISPEVLTRCKPMHLVKASGILTPRELSIINLTVTELLRYVHDKAFTAVEVTTAFCKSAAIAHQATNCLAWIMFEEALSEAAELDEFLRINGRPKGPLHGLPISVKEHIYFKGTPATSGFVAWADNFSSTDALIIQVLRDAGAVFHVKTTNPQGLMALETTSNLYGTTTNPYNTSLTPGGSSGGEAALIAMRGSLLGIGTDIGGSIRVPAAFSGLYGLKPSVARLPHGGLSGAHDGMENIIGCVGPLATSIADLRLFCSVVLNSQPWLREPSLVELPWKASVQTPKTLKIGVMYHDGVVHPHPPVTRCLNAAVEAVHAAGHEIIPWDPSLHAELTACIDKMYLLDAGQEYYDVLAAGQEPATPLMNFILDRTDKIPSTAADSWKVNAERNRLQIAYAKQWNDAEIDVLLCPANASVASAHGESKYWGYSSAFNILDYSAAVFPVGTVKDTDTWDAFPGTAGRLGAQDKLFTGFYDGPEKYASAPVALQLVGRRYREEQVLDILERIVADLKAPRPKILMIYGEESSD